MSRRRRGRYVVALLALLALMGPYASDAQRGRGWERETRTDRFESSDRFFRDLYRDDMRRRELRAYSPPTTQMAPLRRITSAWDYNHNWLGYQYRDRPDRLNVNEKAARLSASAIRPGSAAKIYFPAIFDMIGWGFNSREAEAAARRHENMDPRRPRGRYDRLVLSPAATIVSALPTQAAEFEKVFGKRRHATAVEIQAYRKADRALRRDGHYVGADMKAAFEESSNVILFVGHNEGGKLMLTSGDGISLRDLARRCELAAKLCIFLVCNAQPWVGTDSLGYGRAITPTRAANLAHRVSTILRNGAKSTEPLAPLETLHALIYVTADRHANRYWYYTAGPLFVVTLILWVECQDGKCPHIAKEHQRPDLEPQRWSKN